MSHTSSTMLFTFLVLYSFPLITTPTDYPYPLIKKVVETYKRSLTILDINATKNSPALKIAELPHVAVLLSTNDLLKSLLETNCKLDNVIILQSPITSKILTRLAECEHFDVTLALEPADFIATHFESHLAILLALGENLIAQIPESLLETAKKQGGKPLAQSYSNQLSETIYLVHFTQKKQSLLRSSWHKPVVTEKYRISTTTLQKILYIPKKNRYTFWHAGINFETFKALKGVWPTEDVIESQLEQLEEATDIIVQGKTLIEN